MKRLSMVQYGCLALGTGWLGLQTWMLAEHSAGSGATFYSVPATTITLAALPILVEVCIRAKQWIGALVLGVLFVLLMGYSLPSAIARSGEARDTKTAEVTAYQSAVDAASAAKLVADKECKSGNGGKCKDKRAEQAKAESRVPVRPVVGNSDTARVVAILAPFGITAEKYELFQPIFLPLANEVAVWVLVWLGLSPSLMVGATPAKRARRKVAKKTSAQPTFVAASNDNVVKLRRGK